MKCFKILFCVYCFIIYLPVVIGEVSFNNTVVGRVVNENGVSLAGVEVRLNFYGAPDATTDENGQFELTINEYTDPSCCTAVFSLIGYKQATIVFKYGIKEITVTMQSGESIWSPKLCDLESKKTSRLGWDLKVLLPEKAKVEKVHSSPYSETVQIQIGFKSKSESEYQWMKLTTGRGWFPVIPYKNLLLSHNVEEREIKIANYYNEFIDSNGKVYQSTIERQGMDYHGVYEQGKKWRYIGVGLQTITYENVSSEAMEYFNKITDSMCVDPFRVVKGERHRLSGIPDWR